MMRRVATGLALALLAASAAWGGAFSGSASFEVDTVVHAKGYDGTGGDLVLGVCLDAEAPAASELPLQLALRTWNERRATTGNLDAGAVPGTTLDFTTWALYGVGLCLGLDDPSDSLGYAAARVGGNGVLDRAVGADGVAGSRDDVRGDDANRSWFRILDNDPFTDIGGTVDATTYTRDTAFVAEGESYAAVATRGVATLEGVPGTEAVMVAATPPGEAKRSLVVDDVATLAIAGAGVDGTAGNGDDYTVTLVYVGRGDGCDVPVAFAAQAEVVACATGLGSLVGLTHLRINNASLSFGEAVLWTYDPEGAIFLDGFDSGNATRWSARVP